MVAHARNYRKPLASFSVTVSAIIGQRRWSSITDQLTNQSNSSEADCKSLINLQLWSKNYNMTTWTSYIVTEEPILRARYMVMREVVDLWGEPLGCTAQGSDSAQ